MILDCGDAHVAFVLYPANESAHTLPANNLAVYLAHEEVHSLEVNEIHLFLLIVVVEEFFK